MLTLAAILAALATAAGLYWRRSRQFAAARIREQDDVKAARAVEAADVKAADDRRNEARRQGALGYANEWLRRKP